MIRGELLSWLQFVFLGIVVYIHVLFTFQSFFQNRLKLMELRLAEMLFVQNNLKHFNKIFCFTHLLFYYSFSYRILSSKLYSAMTALFPKFTNECSLYQ
jgi:hypothetical protein